MLRVGGWWGRLRAAVGRSPDVQEAVTGGWEATTDVASMLKLVPADDRRARLFAVAWLRRFGHLMIDPRSRRAVDLAEQWADGLADPNELATARAAAEAAFDQSYETCIPPSVRPTFCLWFGGAVSAANSAALMLLPRPNVSSFSPMSCAYPVANRRFGVDELEAIGKVRVAELAVVARLVRCIYPNPFRRPPPFHDRWRTSTAVGLADAIYHDRAFDRLAVLADALEEAGCDDPDLLAHARGDGPHARGCRVVDAVLGRG